MDTFKPIIDAIKAPQHERILITTHMRPDGDAVGSALGLALAVEKLGKQVTVWNMDGLPEKFEFLPKSFLFQKPPDEPGNFDLVISVDCASFARLGNVAQKFSGNKTFINIDHHISNERFGDLVYIDGRSPATGQIIYEMLKAAGWPITREIAHCLYAAIETDTGSFQYATTTAETLRIAAELVDLGVDVAFISQNIYQSMPMRRVKLLCAVLQTLEFFDEGRISVLMVTQQMMNQTGAIPEDTENLIDFARGVRGVVVAILFEETEEKGTRMSFRSNNPKVNVNEIARQFNGGGHSAAAGARAKTSILETREQALDATRKYLRRTL